MMSLRSPRTILLLNLCLSLFLATFSFLVGIDKVSNQVNLGAGIPGVIVAISLAATRTEGYGSDTYCWLTNQNMLMLAFVIPVGTVVCANIVLLALVFRAMFHSQAVRRKTNRERVGTTLRSLCVLVPLLGVTWIFGFLQSIDYLSEVSQYLFVILNSIQGLFIFVFHCLLDARVREAATRRWRQRSTLIMARQDVSAQTTNSRMSRTFHALRSLTTTSSRISQTSRNSAFTPMLKSQTSEQKSNVQSPGTDRKTETSI
ncbi:PREDICTED: adhesion G protein-coupled receptor B2-like [Priapulus caudatus]|uniref:Adhesion G protein-coupled receptor B2-like n=1 Tax=Priapulus caudatus TaxID=37621 RepID=A0ABM1E8H8_PRICU|nr:PREDICTED: adhesion G protein-coupled receptor B2-like [Priapulus caudatus]